MWGAPVRAPDAFAAVTTALKDTDAQVRDTALRSLADWPDASPAALLLDVIKNDDAELAQKLRSMDDSVDELYSAIKYYLTKISREALGEEESRRWTDIISFTINMEQIGDIIERVLQDLEDKKIRTGRRFSDAGMQEIVHLHERLMANLRLGMSVFLDGHVQRFKMSAFRDSGGNVVTNNPELVWSP